MIGDADDLTQPLDKTPICSDKHNIESLLDSPYSQRLVLKESISSTTFHESADIPNFSVCEDSSRLKFESESNETPTIHDFAVSMTKRSTESIIEIIDSQNDEAHTNQAYNLDDQADILALEKEISQPINALQAQTVIGRFTHFLQHVLKLKGRESRDFYILHFTTSLLALLLTGLGWNAFQAEDDRVTTATSIVTENRMPYPFLLSLLLQFIVIILDRIFYLTKNNKAKLGMHLIWLMLVHMYAFIALPLITNRPFSRNMMVIVIYLIQCVYFAVSAFQLKYGFPHIVLGNALTRDVSNFKYVLFLIYRAIPFLHELRVLLDWTCTRTTVEFRRWVIIDDLYLQLYENKFNLQKRVVFWKKRGGFGKRQIFLQKLLVGALYTTGLLILLWLPLILLTAFSGATRSVPPNEACLKIRIAGLSTIYERETTSLQSRLPQRAILELNSTPELRQFASDFSDEFDITQAVFVSESGRLSSTVEMIKPQVQQWLILKQSAHLIVQLSIRPKRDDSQLIQTIGQFSTKLSLSNLQSLVNVINRTSDLELVIPGALPSYAVVNFNEDTILESRLPTDLQQRRNLSLKLLNQSPHGQLWWSASVLLVCVSCLHCQDVNVYVLLDTSHGLL